MERSTAVKILCLDDDDGVVQMVASLVKAYGYTAVALTDPYAVGPLLADPTVKGVLSDFIMPLRDGLSVLAEVQKVRPDVRRVLVTAAPHEHPVREALRLGKVAQVIAKPPSLADIGAALSGLD